MATFQGRVFLGFLFLLLLFCVYISQIAINHLRPISINGLSYSNNTPSPSPSSSFLIDRLDIDCAGILSNDPSTIDFYRQWVYDSHYVQKEIIRSGDRCSTIKSRFEFRSTPLSREEEEYPLAYGLIVYKNVAQVLSMLSSFYHPQNVYCIAVDENANPNFQIIMRELDNCLPNVHAIKVKKIRWGSYEVLSALYTCFNHLTRLDHKWKYYQYLSGSDVPLKTNLEMVRIFKALNETMNFEMKPYQSIRLGSRENKKPPLKLFKSSMSALVPRAAANRIVKSEKVAALLKFLKGTFIADEAFWATVGGNPKALPLGQLDAGKLGALRKNPRVSGGSRRREVSPIDQVLGTESVSLSSPGYCSFSTPCRNYISRFQLWAFGDIECKGEMSADSCVFGIGDLPTLLNRPELVAHKLYIDYEPAAFFCALKIVNNRTRHPLPFDASGYARLPSVELKTGRR